MSWPTGYAPLTDNHTFTLSGLNASTGKGTVPVAVDPSTGAVLISGSFGNTLVSSPLVGQSKIASTGTAVQLNGGTSQPLSNGVIISAATGNAAYIEIGSSSVNDTHDGTGNGYMLAPGASISFALADTSDAWINGTSGDIVSWAGS